MYIALRALLSDTCTKRAQVDEKEKSTERADVGDCEPLKLLERET